MQGQIIYNNTFPLGEETNQTPQVIKNNDQVRPLTKLNQGDATLATRGFAYTP